MPIMVLCYLGIINCMLLQLLEYSSKVEFNVENIQKQETEKIHLLLKKKKNF